MKLIWDKQREVRGKEIKLLRLSKKKKLISKITMFLKRPSSTPGRDKHMCPLTFLYKIQCSTTFIWSILWYNAYFWQRRALKWFYFPFYVHYYVKHCYLCSPLAPLLTEIKICAHWLFWTKVNAQQLLFEAFFYILGSFCSIHL